MAVGEPTYCFCKCCHVIQRDNPEEGFCLRNHVFDHAANFCCRCGDTVDAKGHLVHPPTEDERRDMRAMAALRGHALNVNDYAALVDVLGAQSVPARWCASTSYVDQAWFASDPADALIEAAEALESDPGDETARRTPNPRYLTADAILAAVDELEVHNE